MSNSKHTPGPWYPDQKGYVWRRPINDLYEYGGGVAGDKPLAIVCKGWWGEGEQGYPIEANVRLLAAAPDLLEALEGLLWYVDQLEKVVYEPDDTETHESVGNARATIAKAKGETK